MPYADWLFMILIIYGSFNTADTAIIAYPTNLDTNCTIVCFYEDYCTDDRSEGFKMRVWLSLLTFWVKMWDSTVWCGSWKTFIFEFVNFKDYT